jgi:hypothetical protein
VITASSSSVDRRAGAVSSGESNIRSGPNSGGRSSEHGYRAIHSS